jgi:hypothetical protein
VYIYIGDYLLYLLKSPRGNMIKTNCPKCDKELEPHRVGKQAHCNPCHAEYMRLTRPKHSELSPEAKMKSNARSYANTYQKRGKIKKENCIKCNNHKTEKHHLDYSKPTEIIWLCRPCHLKEHKVTLTQVSN